MSKKTRKRGVRASRDKLELAMLDAGIRTQAALAERIAAAEQLDSAPKDTVNRVFRQESVAPATLARVARALQVSPSSLYLDGTAGEATPSSRRLQRSLSLLIHPSHEDWQAFAEALKNHLPVSLNSAVVPVAVLADSGMSIDIARQHQVDAVATLRSNRFGRYSLLQLFLYYRGRESLLWMKAHTTAALRQQTGELAAKACGPLLDALEDHWQALEYEQLEAEEKCLRARHLLEECQFASHLQQAQKLARDALRLAPGSPAPHCALAEALIAESWRSDTRALLDEARELLEPVADLAADNGRVASVLALLYRNTGQLSDAIDLCRDYLQQHPGDPDVHVQLGQVCLEDYHRGSQLLPDAGEQAIYHAQAASALEPKYWRHYLDLGNMLFLIRGSLEAQSAFQASIALQPNELALINLGVIRFCQGELKAARSHFEQAAELEPDSYLGLEYLGSIHYYQRHYAKAAGCYRAALERFGDAESVAIHQIWSNLGDVLRLDGDTDGAIGSYLKSIEIIHHDRLQGLDGAGYTLYHYHAWLCLSRLQPERYDRSQLRSICPRLTDLLEQPLNAGGLARLAWLLYDSDDLDHARIAFKRSIALCPVFAQHPDLLPIMDLLHADTAAETA